MSLKLELEKRIPECSNWKGRNGFLEYLATCEAAIKINGNVTTVNVDSENTFFDLFFRVLTTSCAKNK